MRTESFAVSKTSQCVCEGDETILSETNTRTKKALSLLLHSAKMSLKSMSSTYVVHNNGVEVELSNPRLMQTSIITVSTMIDAVLFQYATVFTEPTGLPSLMEVEPLV